MTITSAQVRLAPFFILMGPGDRALSCQWTSAGSSEFEIVCPETPETMGMLFGLYDAKTETFKMRPACREVKQNRKGSPTTRLEAAPEFDLDQNWTGDLSNVLMVGNDWDMGDNGLLKIVPATEYQPIGNLVSDIAA